MIVCWVLTLICLGASIGLFWAGKKEINKGDKITYYLLSASMFLGAVSVISGYYNI